MASLAFRRAPEASWISLIFDPPLPMLCVSMGTPQWTGNVHAAHARVLDDEFDGDGPGAGHGGDVERLVVDTAHDEAEGLGRQCLLVAQGGSSPWRPHPEGQTR
jgi:hypothetical protein